MMHINQSNTLKKGEPRMNYQKKQMLQKFTAVFFAMLLAFSPVQMVLLAEDNLAAGYHDVFIEENGSSEDASDGADAGSMTEDNDDDDTNINELGELSDKPTVDDSTTETPTSEEPECGTDMPTGGYSTDEPTEERVTDDATEEDSTEEDSTEEKSTDDPTDELCGEEYCECLELEINALAISISPFFMGHYVAAGDTEIVSGPITGDVTVYGTLILNANHEIEGTVTVKYDGEFHMSNGVVTGAGHGVVVEAGGIFTMSGGEISGNANSGVHVSGTGAEFTMTSGTISGNTAVSGGGVLVADGAEFTMSGTALIYGNTAANASQGLFDSLINHLGGGVFVTGGSTFTMEGGTIENNSANRGAGVGVAGGGSEFIMTDGKISDNTTASGNIHQNRDGGGVYVTGIGGNQTSTCLAVQLKITQLLEAVACSSLATLLTYPAPRIFMATQHTVLKVLPSLAVVASYCLVVS